MPPHRMWLVHLYLSVILTISSCGFREGPPRLEPVEFGGGGSSGSFGAVTTVSTNCAEIGEWVTFEVTLHNGSEVVVELTDTPPFDLILEPAWWELTTPKPIDRWSESYQYPQEIDRVFEPGERQSYTWKWQAKSTFAQQARDVNMMQVTFWQGQRLRDGRSPASAGTNSSYIGVAWYAEGTGSWRCADMRR
ncbi:MAG: hypothetical protein GFH27_549325n7 [Chloroflexi bacterium AL-W]|nr:hypothetical protein [Chloroflexi bacterium AL-N1]NOK70143.1 hypothetical protein [Chloroflexi bacterium AL-N10]NOK77845.1 hypothetical protein [Chloroflexi bacterium AL-N5]NOK84854.1 hypothetical protein [Chloroflexi bacterium AL-W]NOK91833.1 hypothetical protein [Chloroflexi bacterium AL-N15]